MRHTETVLTVAAREVGGRMLLASGGVDQTVRMWDPATGRPMGEPMRGHTGSVWALAAVERPEAFLLARRSSAEMNGTR
jgi:hypothetical protein